MVFMNSKDQSFQPGYKTIIGHTKLANSILAPWPFDLAILHDNHTDPSPGAHAVVGQHLF